MRTFCLPAVPLTVLLSCNFATCQTFQPVVDATVFRAGGSDPMLVDNLTGIFVNASYSARIDTRGIVEFDVSAVSDQSVLTAASLSIYATGFTSSGGDGGPEVRVFGYAGDGLATVSDATGTFPLVAIGPTVESVGPVGIPLDVAAIESLLSSGFVGFQFRSSLDEQNLTFASLEHQFFDAATLSLRFQAVPEPSSNLLGIAVLLIANTIRCRRICVK